MQLTEVPQVSHSILAFVEDTKERVAFLWLLEEIRWLVTQSMLIWQTSKHNCISITAEKTIHYLISFRANQKPTA